MKSRIGRLGLVVALGVGAITVAPVVAQPDAPASAQTNQLGAGGEYHPLDPTRIFDSRVPALDGPPAGKKRTSSNGTEFSIPVLGKGGVPADGDDVLAVVVGVVVAGAEARGNLTLYPKGSPAGTSSLVNYFPGRNVPNLAIVGVGDGGNIAAKLTTPGANSRAHVVLDVFGWFATSASGQRGARLIPAGPNRILDTREQGGVLGSRQSRAVQVRGRGGVPNSNNVTGVVVNLTAINRQQGSTNTYLSLTPNPVPSGSSPSTSNVNVVPNHVKAAMAIVPIGADGRVHLYNHSGRAHAAIDVIGYLQTGHAADSRAGRVVPLDAPFRVFDTRLAAFGNAPLGARSAENWSFRNFAQSVTLGGTAIGGQSALIGNLTGTGLQRLYPSQPVTTYLSMYPGGTSRPNASTLNVPERENVPNLAMVRYGDVGSDPYVSSSFNYNGSIHYLLDVLAVVLE